MTSHTQLLVCNSENRFVGSFYHNLCRVQRSSRFFKEKKTILGHTTVYALLFLAQNILCFEKVKKNIRLSTLYVLRGMLIE